MRREMFFRGEEAVDILSIVRMCLDIYVNLFDVFDQGDFICGFCVEVFGPGRLCPLLNETY